MSEYNDNAIPQRKRRRGQKMTVEERQIAQETFLKALANTANVRAACIQAGVDHTTIYRWQEHDEEFGIRFRQANEDANWLIFGECWRRAMQGEERYVTSQGKVVIGPDGKPLTYREKSDRLLELMLKARISAFRDRQQVEMSGSVDVNGAKEKLLQKLGTLISDATTNEAK